MGNNTSITLGGDYDAFIQRQIAKGRFGTASEAIRAGLRLLEDEENRLDTLRAAIDEGDNSGPSVPFDVKSYLASKRGA